MNNTEKFCEIVRQRSSEHEKAITLLTKAELNGQVVSVLRQELDSMIRVIFLLKQSPVTERERLIELTLTGQRWRKMNNDIITDGAMVDLANKLNGWEKSVYDFGCSFIHLSIFHDYVLTDPFQNIEQKDIIVLKGHLNQYHEFPISNELSINSVSSYLPKVFNKIKDNLEFYLRILEKGGAL